MLNDERLQTPRGDGSILVEPAVSHWAALLADRTPPPDFRLAGRSVADLRADLRARLALPADGHVLACGHQPAFIHPGVWAKNVLLSRVAQSHQVHVIDFVVDNDAPTSASMAVPTEGQGNLLAVDHATVGHAAAGVAYEGRPLLAQEDIDSLRQQLRTLLGPRFELAAIQEYLDGLCGCRVESQSRNLCGTGFHSCGTGFQPVGLRDFVDQHLAGRRQLDTRWQVDLPQIRVSEAFGGSFVADLLLNGDRFAAIYNGALAQYRREHNVRGHDRPLPDLGHDGDCVETALWAYQIGQRRRRLWVRVRAEALELLADGVVFGRLGRADLERDPEGTLATLWLWVIRPRALTLTLWARLLACDLFVHGIGGAKYDRITDTIFRDYYRCEPPPLACVSATLHMPLPRHNVTAEDLAHARRALRDLRYNPDRYLPSPPADLSALRRELIEQSRHLRKTQGPKVERHRVFRELRQVNNHLVESNPQVAEEMHCRVEELGEQLLSNRIADGREYFYALYPRERLNLLVDRLDTAAGA